MLMDSLEFTKLSRNLSFAIKRITPPPGCHYAHLERNDPHPDIPSSLTTPVVWNDPRGPSTSTPRNACVVNEPCPYLLQPQGLPHAIVCSGPLDGQAYTSTVREEGARSKCKWVFGFSESAKSRHMMIFSGGTSL
ncbi:hypothetical protein TNIN_424651 [Trichonephila inaurata madagascariensis]|uniref:Uncharacterized protein n=1 Tax=Trichonephila inaurata madagascariensis TaxID=2747483 RepID=A0A8X6WZU6_9ARAC|nr:hypothetical protein TNIN_424651 [Trichonephila inaurata madagascariensis]